MLRKNLNPRRPQENGDIVQMMLIVAGFAIVAMLGINFIGNSVKKNAESVASEVATQSPYKVTESKENSRDSKVKIESVRETSGMKLASDEYYATYSIINDKKNDNPLKQEIEEFRVANIGQVGKEFRVPNSSLSSQRETVDPEYDTFIRTNDALGNLDVVVEYYSDNSDTKQLASYLSANPQREGL